MPQNFRHRHMPYGMCTKLYVVLIRWLPKCHMAQDQVISVQDTSCEVHTEPPMQESLMQIVCAQATTGAWGS